MSTLFISDLHLDPSRPEIIDEFIAFNEEKARNADAYYILGDFLEYWIGDDHPAEHFRHAFNSLMSVSNSGVPTYLMHGNRDFLIGNAFAERYNLTLLPDPCKINLYGQDTLLMHGDSLCTDDIKYQNFRKQVRSPQWQQEFLSKSIEERINIVTELRKKSKSEMSEKTEDIMDVNQAAVDNIMQEHNVIRLIHGHTHRPEVHTFLLNDQNASRIVLGDWYKTSSYLEATDHNFYLIK